MTKVFTALSVSVDGYITGRDPGAGNGLGDASMLFDWYFDGDTPSEVLGGFKLSEPSARVFDAAAERIGAVVRGRNTYDDSGWDKGGTPHEGVPLVVLSHRPAPAEYPEQTFVSTGIEDAIEAARQRAGDGDVVLLGAGRSFFQELPSHVRVRLVEAVPAPGVTHLHYAVER